MDPSQECYPTNEPIDPWPNRDELEHLANLFPWPPPQWSTLDLSPEELTSLHSYEWTDKSIIYMLNFHLIASGTYHYAHKSLFRRQKPGLWNSFRNHRHRRRIRKALRSMCCDIVVNQFEFTTF